jgi:hypothetical protein
MKDLHSLSDELLAELAAAQRRPRPRGASVLFGATAGASINGSGARVDHDRALTRSGCDAERPSHLALRAERRFSWLFVITRNRCLNASAVLWWTRT